jgi:hypothetical protein
MLQLTKYFISTPQAKALGAWGLATPLYVTLAVSAYKKDRNVVVSEDLICTEPLLGF